MPVNAEVYFIHGWGYDSSFWYNWVQNIKEDVPFKLFDRGYFSEHRHDFFDQEAFLPKILIVHSFGLHFVPAHFFQTTQLLVLISGFRHFHENNPNYKFSRRQISLMKQRLINNPEQLLEDFYYNCGNKKSGAVPKPIVNGQLLYDDLLVLDTNKIDLATLEKIPQVLLMHGEDDRIVNPEHSRLMNKELLNSKLFVKSNAEHMLPITNAQWCMKLIDDNQKNFTSKIFASTEISSHQHE